MVTWRASLTCASGGSTTISSTTTKVSLYLNGTFQAWDNTTGTLGAYPSLNNTNGKINTW